jgi:hypothetical protein
MASNAVDASASLFSGFCPRWLVSVSQQDGIATKRFTKIGALRQGRLSATTSEGSVSQLVTVGSRLKVKVSYFTLTVYHQSVRLGAKPLEAHGQSCCCWVFFSFFGN